MKRSLLRKKSVLPNIAIGIILVIYTITNFSHHKWTRAGEFPKGVIVWDVISYYAYLPASFIHNDLSLDFVDEPDFENNNHFWYVTADNGNKVILTSMGVSIMYSPFFLMAHTLAPVFGKTPDGFSSIYEFFLVFSALVYTFLAFLLLKKLLTRYFSSLTAAISILLIGIGTNLYYYSTYEAAMSHSFSFSLIVGFVFLILKWLEKPNIKWTVLTGLVYGLIVLIRPTNILLIILLLFAGLKSFKEIPERIGFFIKNWHFILLMIFSFVIIWIPQFIYWYQQTGHLFYNAYEKVGSAFFFGHPHITDVLFSYRKGLFIYVPLCLFSVLGIFLMIKEKHEFGIAIGLYFMVMLYVLSSWWSWWFGGSYGPRTFIDFYGVLAFPLAALIYRVENSGKAFRLTGIILASVLFLHSILQTRQYSSALLHHFGTTKESYWSQHVLRFKPAPGYWQKLSIPDAYLARRGVYYNYSTGVDYKVFSEMPIDQLKEMVSRELASDKTILREINRFARRMEMSPDEAFKVVSNHIVETKRNGGP